MKIIGIERGVYAPSEAPFFEFTQAIVVMTFFRLCWVCKCTVELDTLVGSIDGWPEGITVFRTNLSCYSVHMYFLFIDL